MCVIEDDVECVCTCRYTATYALRSLLLINMYARPKTINLSDVDLNSLRFCEKLKEKVKH